MSGESWLCAGCCAVLAAAIAAPTVQAEMVEEPARLLGSDGESSVIEFRFPANPEIQLLTAAVGFPEGSEPLLEVLEFEITPPLTHPEDFFLRQAVGIDLDGRLGTQRVLRIVARRTLEPPSGEEQARACRRIVVRVSPSASGNVGEETTQLQPHFEPLLRAVLLNYESLGRAKAERGRQGIPTLSTRASAAANEGASTPALKVGVKQDGIFRITASDLAGAGVNTSAIDPRRLAMTFKGQPVSIWIPGEEDGSFDAEDRIVFVGTAPTGFAAPTNVYWLTEGATAGPRMPTRDVPPLTAGAGPADFAASVVAERDPVLAINNFDTTGDYYYWQILFNQADPFRADYDVVVPDPAAPADGALLTAFLEGRTGNHHARVYWNGAPAGTEVFWFSLDSAQITASLDAASILNGTNIVRVEMVDDTDTGTNSIYVNRFRLDYRRRLRAPGGALAFEVNASAVPIEVSDIPGPDLLLLDVTSSTQPARLTGASLMNNGGSYRLRFQDPVATEGAAYSLVEPSAELAPEAIQADVPSHLREVAQGADYIVVSHPDFLSALAPLMAHRQSQGLRTMLVDVTDVYDEFSDGIFDPEAIHRFVKFAYESWERPAPTYLLLVGDANIDYQDRIGTGVRDFLPTVFFLAPTVGITPQDNHYAAVSGDDALPDLFVGRLPVKTAAQAQGLVAKIIAYETAGTIPSINSRALLVADNDDPNFEGILNALEGNHLLPTGRTVTKVYLRSQPSTTAARDALVAAVNSGEGTVAYLGHGNFTNWAQENLITVNDVGRFTNTGRYPFFAALNCLNGFYAGPRPGTSDPSLSEALLLPADRGAVAYFSTSVLGALSDYDRIGGELYDELYRGRSLTLGGASTMAKVQAYLNLGVGAANLPGLNFLGDPATPFSLDSDGDGLIDFHEIGGGANPDDSDSDDDGLADGAEPEPRADADGDGRITVLDPDSDADGISDGLEAGVTLPPAGTDLSRGLFTPDADPASVTSPINPDSDGGGAPDSAEDRNLNGAVDGTETDPTDPLDDPVCSDAAPPELDPVPVSGLRVEAAGSDLLIRWTDASSVDPCMIYHLYVAANRFPKNSAAAFTLLAITGRAEFRHVGAAVDVSAYDYLVAGYSFSRGEGPLGHYGR